MNRIKTLVLLVTTAILPTAPNLKAQQEVFIANVPFQFSVGNRTLAPGEYRIARRNAFLTVQSRRDSSSAVILTSSAQLSSDGRISLMFDQVNDLYFLRGIIAPVNSFELAVSNVEKKATKEQRRLSTVSLPVVTSTVVQSGGR